MPDADTSPVKASEEQNRKLPARNTSIHFFNPPTPATLSVIMHSVTDGQTGMTRRHYGVNSRPYSVIKYNRLIYMYIFIRHKLATTK